MVNIGLYVWWAWEGDNIGGLRGPLLVVLVVDVEWLCNVFFAGYDIVGIDFLEYAEDGPLPGVVVDRSEGRDIAMFCLVDSVDGGNGGLLVDMVRIAVLFAS